MVEMRVIQKNNNINLQSDNDQIESIEKQRLMEKRMNEKTHYYTKRFGHHNKISESCHTEYEENTN